MNRRTLARAALASALAVLACGAAWAQADDQQAYGDDYRVGDYGRVRSLENGLTIRRAADPAPVPDDDAALLNAPIYPGDTVVTGPDQRAEIELAGGTIVRIDRGSEVTFLALPSPYATVEDNTVLQLAAGAMRLTAALVGATEFRVDTPATSVYLLDDGDFRIEMTGSDATRVTSRRGVAEVVGADGSVLVRGGMETVIWAGSVPDTPRAFNTFAADAFDRWVDRREDSLRIRDRYAGGGRVYENLPDEVRPYYGELAGYGDWSYVSDYGYVWTPRGVASGWRPYYDGYWDYGPSGYFWVASEPWGWAPYHYGRWSWIGGRGWCWIPGRVFAGAWVAWSWGSAYVGWSPLDYWGNPCWAGHRSYYGYYDPYAWTFVSYTNIHHHHYPRYAVPVDQIHDHIGDNWVGTRPPRESPARLARSPEVRARALREVSGHEAARLRPREGDGSTARHGRSLGDVDRALLSDRAGLRRDAAADAARGGRDRSAVGRAVVGGATDARVMPRYPRRISTPGNSVTPGQTGRRGRPDAVAPGGSSSRGGTARGTEDRVRSLYERMASPRKTRDRTGTAPGDRQPAANGRRQPSASGRTADRPAPSNGSGRAPAARPRPTTPPPAGDRGKPRPERGRSQPRRAEPKRDDDSRSSPRSDSRGQRVSTAPDRAPTSPRSRARTFPSRTAPSRSSAAPRRTAPSRSSAAPRRTAPSRSSATPRRTAPSRSPASARRSAPARSAPARSGASRGRSKASKRSGKKKE